MKYSEIWRLLDEAGLISSAWSGIPYDNLPVDVQVAFEEALKAK
jgi:hypothetical protein